MKIEPSDLFGVFSKVFKQDVQISPDVPLMESGLRLDSLRIIRLLVEIENLVRFPLPQEEAFEFFSLSINQLTSRLNTMQPTTTI